MENSLARGTQLTHGIEKGLSFRVRKKPFFSQKIKILMSHVNQLIEMGKAVTDARMQMIRNALTDYLEFHDDKSPPNEVTAAFENILEKLGGKKHIPATLKKDTQHCPEVTLNEYEKFVISRH
jgi:hypothetical protein